jgi:hypothetical protein
MGIDRIDIYLAFPIIKPSPPPLLKPDVRGAPGCFPWGRYHQSREKHLWELLVTGCADVFLAKFCEGRFIICPGMVTITKRTSRTVSWRKVWIHQIQNGCLSSLLACLHSCSFQCFSLNRNKIHGWWFCRKVSLPARVCPFSSLKTKSLSKTSPFLYASCKMLLDVQCGKKWRYRHGYRERVWFKSVQNWVTNDIKTGDTLLNISSILYSISIWYTLFS